MRSMAPSNFRHFQKWRRKEAGLNRSTRPNPRLLPAHPVRSLMQMAGLLARGSLRHPAFPALPASGFFGFCSPLTVAGAAMASTRKVGLTMFPFHPSPCGAGTITSRSLGCRQRQGKVDACSVITIHSHGQSLSRATSSSGQTSRMISGPFAPAKAGSEASRISPSRRPIGSRLGRKPVSAGEK